MSESDENPFRSPQTISDPALVSGAGIRREVIPFESGHRRARWTIWLLALGMFLDVAGMASTYSQVQMLEGVEQGARRRPGGSREQRYAARPDRHREIRRLGRHGNRFSDVVSSSAPQSSCLGLAALEVLARLGRGRVLCSLSEPGATLPGNEGSLAGKRSGPREPSGRTPRRRACFATDRLVVGVVDHHGHCQPIEFPRVNARGNRRCAVGGKLAGHRQRLHLAARRPGDDLHGSGS